MSHTTFRLDVGFDTGRIDPQELMAAVEALVALHTRRPIGELQDGLPAGCRPAPVTHGDTRVVCIDAWATFCESCSARNHTRDGITSCPACEPGGQPDATTREGAA